MTIGSHKLRRTAVLSWLVGIGLAAAVAGAVYFWAAVEGSLPPLQGSLTAPGLAAPVRIERDPLGVPTLRAENRTDLAYATGFLHAQDRFFQMDLLRRTSAGELAEILGPAALERDRGHRIHRFRQVARRALNRADAEEKDLVEAYASGVNAGLRALRARPFEYQLLGAEPSPWLPEDTFLPVLTLFLYLWDEEGHYESTLGTMQATLAPELYRFLSPMGVEDWDAPITGEPVGMPPLPGAEALDLRRQSQAALARSSPDWRTEELEPFVAGSNSWAITGSRTAFGGAVVANDIHLDLVVPNVWYRASFIWPSEDGENRLTGVTLPGTPLMVLGSNTYVAWAFSNALADTLDLVVLETEPGRDGTYRTPDGPRRFERHLERIAVKRGEDETLEVLSTIWGPVFDRDSQGRPRALRWIAHEPEAVDLGLRKLEAVRGVGEALDAVQRAGIPPQNLIVADRSGKIAWTVIGRLPRRVGFSGRLPGSWADGSRRWEGWLEASEYPRVLEAPSDVLWTANARVVGGRDLELLGDGGYVLGARGRQIRDRLLVLEGAVEKDMLAIQLDNRSFFLDRWQKLLLRELTGETDARRAEMRRYVEDWGGRAEVDSVGFRVVRTFRAFLVKGIMETLTAPCHKADPGFRAWDMPQTEGPVWRLLSERPAHLLDPAFPSWEALIQATVDETLDYFLRDGASLAERTWGERNTVRVRHPLSSALPFLGRWLDMPVVRLGGATHMPHVQFPLNGASLRMAVSPGREDQGYFHQPAGQSGHPRSPHYRDSHRAWVEGRVTPFLPGPTVHTLTLVPADEKSRRAK